MNTSKLFDVIIIGAGPAGLSSAIYTGRAKLNTLVLEKSMPGGQILMTDWVENYPGFPEGVAPFPLVEGFRKQAEKFGAEIETAEVNRVDKQDNHWQIVCGEKKYLTQALIIATGSNYRKLEVPGEKELTGRGVSYCATCDGAFFRDKTVGVAGGGSLALTEAVFLTKFAREVKLIHRRAQFRGEKILQDRATRNDKISFVLDTIIEKINGGEKLASLTIKNVKTNKVSELRLDGIFISVGMNPNTGFLNSLLDLNEKGEIAVTKGMATSKPGIYAAGDVTDACSKQVATAVGSGVEAAIAADEYIENM